MSLKKRTSYGCALLIGLGFIVVCNSSLGVALAESTKEAKLSAHKSLGKSITMDVFLDRLMMAESGGRDYVKAARSSALGPFQFIVSTFLDVARRHFPTEIAELSTAQVLALRTNRAFARKAARAYTEDNATRLAAAGKTPSFANLRLAFLLGPSGAIRILSAPPEARLSDILGGRVIRANPFMARMTASDLIRRAARDILVEPKSTAGLARPGVSVRKSVEPRIRLRCNLARPSCRRWLALKKRQLSRTAPRKIARK